MRNIKTLFSTPKRTAISITVIVAFFAAAGASATLCIRAAAKSNSIGRAAAEQIALADVGAEVAAARFQETEFSYEDGQFVYEVEFYTDLGEYEYTIAATDGDILWREWDLNDTSGSVTSIAETTTAVIDAAEEITVTTTAAVTANETTVTTAETTVTANKTTVTTTSVAANNTTTTTAAAAQISLDDAKAIVLADAGVSNSDVTFTKEKLDREKGTWYYDLEFYTADTEYDYEVYVETGKIVSKDVKSILSDDTSSDFIGIDAAKEIALKDAGVSADLVTFTKAKLEKDDGISAYEITFLSGTVEYEYTIKAADGTILEYDIDHN